MSLNPDRGPGQGIQGRKTASNCGDPPPSSGVCDGRGKILEKIVSYFFGGTVDQALAELGQLASDLRLDIVRQKRAAVFFGERHSRAALCKAGNTSIAFAGNLVAVGWIEVGELYPALKP